MAEFPTAICKGCGRPIVWAVNPKTGKKVPLDPSAQVYHVRTEGGVVQCLQDERTTVMVNHFQTCSKANEFNKGGKSS
jgi:hypothetical protein